MIRGFTFPYQQSADPLQPDPALMEWQPEENQPRVEPPPPLNQGFFAFIKDAVGAALNTATLSATVTGVATMLRFASLARTFSAAMTGVATMLRFASLARIFSATVTGSATLARLAMLFRAFSATVTGAASFLAATVSPITLVTLSATATGIATLLSAVTRFVTPFTGHGGMTALDKAQTRWQRRAATWKRRR